MANLPRNLVEALRNREVVPFVGAGISRAVTDHDGKALFPTWRGLLQAAADRLRANGVIKKANRVEACLGEDDFLDAAMHARAGMESEWFDFLKSQFDPAFDNARAESLELARAVWRLGSPLVLTTNYDKVLRWASSQQPDLRHWTAGDRVNLVDIQRDCVGHPAVWHLHGFIDRPEEIILTPDGYQLLYPAGDNVKVDYEAALSTLRHLFTARNILFLGFGMEDAIRQQIRWVRETFAGAGGKHFVLVHGKQEQAMQQELAGLSVQTVPFADYDAPLRELLRELAVEADSGGPRLPPPLPRLEDPKPYLEYLRNDSAYIEIRGLRLNVAEAPRFPIDDLYIPLIDEAGGRRGLEEALTRKRLVILGDPGSGKTTFLRHIAHAACERRLADAATPFPLMLRVSELSEFVESQDRKDVPALIPRLLARQTRELSVPLDEYLFERQITQGPCLMLIDGLDEAPNEPARETVSKLIERAARAWSNCQFVVTTRPQAYEGEVMLTGFHHARIGALEPEAVRTFLERWSAALLTGQPERARSHAAELIKAVESRVDLRRIASNPVMLTALALLQWNERRMPEQRADLYESVLLWLARSRKGRKGRLIAESCIKVLQELAGAMQGHPEGRQVQASREWAAEVLAPQFEGDPARALAFLKEEEADSGIVVNRGGDVKFWHLTFQEFLAARLLAEMDDAARYELLFAQGRAWLPEWREVVLLLAGYLHQKRVARVDALITAALDHLYGSTVAKRMFHWMGVKPGLAEQARCFGLLGAVLRDLQPLGFKPADARYDEVKNAVLGIFKVETAAGISLKTRLEAAEALGQAGDPRLRVPRDPDYWVLVGDFEIGKYPVTVYEYTLFVEDGGPKPTSWDEQLLRPNCPVVRVNWFEAKAYCDWAGVRLPTEPEWKRAWAGAQGREFPWGNEPPDPDRANYGATKLGKTSPVGLFPLGLTPEGIADLAGNVHEWDAARGLNGGSWLFDNVRFDDWGNPDVRIDVIGFRCAREVNPLTL